MSDRKRALKGTLAGLLALALWPGLGSGLVPPARSDSAGPVIARAEALIGKNQFAEAVALLEQAVREARAAQERDRLRLALADAHLYWAKSLENSYQKAAAIEHYKAAYETDSELRRRVAAVDLNAIGEAYVALGESGKAMEYFRKALPVLREVGYREGEAVVLNNLGGTYSDLGENQKALELYGQALQIHRAVGNRPAEAVTLNNVGAAYARLGERQKALEYFREALPIRRKFGDQRGEAETLNNIGAVHDALGESRKALEYYEQSLAIRRVIGDRAGEAATLNNAGAAYADLGEGRKALEYYEKALPIRRALGDRRGEARSLNDIGLVYSNLGENRKALENLGQALPILRAVSDRGGEAATLNNIGQVYSNLGEKTKSLEYYEQALTLERSVSDRAGEAATLNNIGQVYSELGEKRKALEYFERALPISRSVGDRRKEALHLNNMGLVYDALGEKDRALAYYEQALPILRAVGDRRGEALALNNIGLVYGTLGAAQKALDYYEAALALDRAVGDRRSAAVALQNSGKAYHDLGKVQKALECYESALVLEREVGDRTAEGITLSNMGELYAALGETRKALDYYERALPIQRSVGDRTGEAPTLVCRGNAYSALGEKQRALKDYEKALSIQREVGNPMGEAAAAWNLMSSWDALSMPRVAVFYGKQAVNLYQQVRVNIHGLSREFQSTYRKTISGAYRLLADILIAQGRLPEAQQVLGLLKQEEFFEFVRREAKEASSLDARATLTPEEAEWQRRYAAVADRIAGLGRRRGELERKKERTPAENAELERLDDDLAVAGKAFQAFLDQLAREFGTTGPGKERVFEVREAQGLMQDLRELEKGTVALYTLVGEKSVRIILITPDFEKAAASEISSADLARKVFAFRQVLQDPRRDPRPLAEELYRLVVGPVASDLSQAGARTLLWSLDGVLRYMPIAGLHDGKQYLVERYRNVIFTPASNARLKDQPTARWRGVGLGVSRAHEGFPRLPGVPSELRGIFGDSQGRTGVLSGTILLDDAFTAKAMRAAIRGQEPVVHVASHFRFSAGNETDSFLLLGDGSHLTLDQVRSSVNLFAGVDLLTLSACETAMGGEANGKEVEGFAVLAQRQGAKAVVASLWPVEDASTSLLMRELYRVREATPGTAKVEALRQAQLALLQGRVKLTEQEKAGRNMEAVRPKEGGAKTEPSSSPFVSDPQAPFAHPYFWAPFILIGNFK